MTIHFLSLETVLRFHARGIELYGGTAELRDRALLESAVAQPMATFGGEYLHADVFEMAAAYLYHLVQNHAFVDGNKRVGLFSAIAFLEANGVSTETTYDLYELVLAVAEGRMEKPAITVELRRAFT